MVQQKTYDHYISCSKKLGSEWTSINSHSVTHFGWWCKVKSPSLHSALGRGTPTQRHANFTVTFHGTVMSWPNDTIDAGTINGKIKKNDSEHNLFQMTVSRNFSPTAINMRHFMSLHSLCVQILIREKVSCSLTVTSYWIFCLATQINKYSFFFSKWLNCVTLLCWLGLGLPPQTSYFIIILLMWGIWKTWQNVSSTVMIFMQRSLTTPPLIKSFKPWRRAEWEVRWENI